MPRPNERCDQCERSRPCGPDGLCHECRVKLDDIEQDIDFTKIPDIPPVSQGRVEPAVRTEQTFDARFSYPSFYVRAYAVDSYAAVELVNEVYPDAWQIETMNQPTVDGPWRFRVTYAR